MGSTYDNAENLATKFLEIMQAQYQGTTLGKQELNGELFKTDDTQLWTA